MKRRRFMAGLLALVMIMTNVCANVTTVWANDIPSFQNENDGMLEPMGDQNPESEGKTESEAAEDGVHRLALKINDETNELETYTIGDLGTQLLAQEGLNGGLSGTWASSDDSVLRVSGNGSAEVLNAGTVEVTFTYHAQEEKAAPSEDIKPATPNNAAENEEETAGEPSVSDTQEESGEPAATEAAAQEESTEAETTAAEETAAEVTEDGTASESTEEAAAAAEAAAEDALADSAALQDGEELSWTVEVYIELSVKYIVNPSEAGQIRGNEAVAAGDTLTFTVVPEEGYMITSVNVNGEAVEPVDSDNPEAAGNEKVYQVDTSDENLVVEAELIEGIPGAVYTAETEDAVFTIEAPDGAFLEPVELTATKIKDEERLEEIGERTNAAVDGAIAGFLAYDITFVSQETGEEVEPLRPVSVSVKLKTAVVNDSEAAKEVTGMSVVHLTDDGEAEVVAEAAAPVMPEAVEEAAAAIEMAEPAEIVFEADGFSEYVFAALALPAAALEHDGIRTEYTTLQEALDEVDEGGNAEDNVIDLLRDVQENVVSTDKSYTLNMNNYVIDSAANDMSVYVINGGHVIIRDGMIRGGDRRGKDKKGHRTVVNGIGIHIENAEVDATGLIVTGNVSTNAKNGDDTLYGVGLYAKNSTVRLENSEISENKGDYRIDGTAISLDGTNLTMVNTVVTENSLDSSEVSSANLGSKGIIYLRNNSSLTGSGLEIINNSMNSASGSAGGAICSENSDITLKNKSVVSTNAITNNGTVIKIDTGRLEISDTEIVGNVNGSSGTLYLNNVSGSMKNVEMDENSHGIYYKNTVADNKFTIDNLRLLNTGKDVSSTGSVLNVNTVAPFEMSNSKVCNSVFGGSTTRGIIQLSGTGEKVLRDCDISDNIINGSAPNVGGSAAICVDSNSTVRLEGCILTNNDGSVGGKAGAIYADATLIISESKETGTKTLIAQNKGQKAGAIYISSKGNVTIDGAVIRENVSVLDDVTAGGIYVQSNSSATLTMKSGAVYQNRFLKGTKGAYDLYFGNNVNVDILPAGQMSDDGMDFTGYVWMDTEKKAIIENELTKNGSARKFLAINKDHTWLAKIGDEKYYSVADAVNAAQDGDVIELNEDLRQIGITSSIQISKEITIRLNDCLIIGPGGASNPRNTFLVTTPGNLTLIGPGRMVSGKLKVGENAKAVIEGTLDIDTQTAGGGNPVIVQGGELVINGAQNTVDVMNDTDGVLKVNGPIADLQLTAKPVSKNTVINSHITKLTLAGGGSVNTPASIIAGEGFAVDLLDLSKYSLTKNAYQPFVKEAQGPVPDWIIIRGKIDEKMAPEVKWTSSWDNPLAVVGIRPIEGSEDKAIALYLAGNTTISLKPSGENGECKNLTELKEALAQAKAAGLEVPIVYVEGTVKINGEEEWDLTGYETRLVRKPGFFANMFSVPGTATLKLSNIIIDGGYADASSAIANCAMIQVEKGGTLEIGENTVLMNNYRSSESKNGNLNTGGGAVYGEGATISMTGGEIKNNRANFGGGVAISGGTFIMSGGTISGNTAFNSSFGKSSGGGVFVSNGGKMVMENGLITGNTAYNGGGIGVGAENIAYSSNWPSLEMEGGVIDSNTATSQGGGLYLQSKTKARIMGGQITNNECLSNNPTGGLFGGGGIYVNGGKLVSSGELYINDPLITNNSANSRGGAFAGCPTSKDQIYLNNGGVIAGNTGSNGANDIYISGITIGGMKGSPSVFLTPLDSEGRAYHWKDVVSNEEVPMRDLDGRISDRVLNVYTELKVPSDEEHAVLLSGNHSYTTGGAIGTNGNVTIGGPTNTKVKVTKIWDDGLTDNDRPVRVTVELYQGKKLAGSDEIEWDKDPIATDTIKGPEWTRTFTNLLETDAAGNRYYYRVQEKTDELDGKYESVVKQEDAEGYNWTITNKPVYALELTKLVSVTDASTVVDSKFRFQIELRNADETPYTGPIDTVFYEGLSDKTGTAGSISFIDGRTEEPVVLEKDQTILLKDLSKGMKYRVVELEGHHADEVAVKFNDTDFRPVENVWGDIKLGKNSVIFQNKYGPSGDLTVRKTVSGAGAENDTTEFSFTVSLSDTTISGSYGDMQFTDGVAEFKLRANQSKSAVGLPVGITYTVEEASYEELGYRTSYTGKTGTIAAGEKAEAVVENERIGGLTVSKMVLGEYADTEKDFTFTVSLSDKTVNGTYGDMVFENGVATFPLRHGQSRKAEGLRAGIDYTVTESDNAGYEVSANGETGTIERNVIAAATFVNTLITGDLTVTKTVTGNRGDTSKDFTFTVTLGDTTISGAYGGMNFTDGVATFTLRHGESRTASGLPAGTAYTVTESDNEGYTVSAAGDTGTIPAGGTATAAFTNNRSGDNPPPPGQPGDNPPPPEIITITDEPTPLSSFETIEDEDVPLAFMAPMTGDEKPVGAAMLFGLVALGMMSVFGILAMKREEEDQ